MAGSILYINGNENDRVEFSDIAEKRNLGKRENDKIGWLGKSDFTFLFPFKNR